jgi:hypothetical protein
VKIHLKISELIWVLEDHSIPIEVVGSRGPSSHHSLEMASDDVFLLPLILRQPLLRLLPPFLFTSCSMFSQSQSLSSLTMNIRKNINIHNTKIIYYKNIYFIKK